jgi:hypothetical protein
VGGFLGDQPQVQAVYCNPDACQKASLAKALRGTGKLDGAEDVARTCIEDVSKDLLPQACSEECSEELSAVLYQKAGRNIDGLPVLSTTDKKMVCESTDLQLQEALALADEDTLFYAISERQKRLSEKCSVELIQASPVPTPTIQVEVIRQQIGVTRTIIDVRVLELNQPLPGLSADDFSVTINGDSVPLQVESRQGDNPVCIIVVADNSGSIYDGLNNIRAAIQKLNDFRKPGDQLGLVSFASRSEVAIKQAPSTDPLNPNVINGSGNLTALWDGVLEGLVAAQSCTTENRFLVVMTDGQDNDSRHLEGDNADKAREIARQATEQGVDVCTVGITSKVDANSLRLLTTGCDFYYAEDFESIANQFQSLIGYVRDFYRIILPPDVIGDATNVILKVRQSVEVTIDFTNP